MSLSKEGTPQFSAPAQKRGLKKLVIEKIEKLEESGDEVDLKGNLGRHWRSALSLRESSRIHKINYICCPSWAKKEVERAKRADRAAYQYATRTAKDKNPRITEAELEAIRQKLVDKR